MAIRKATLTKTGKIKLIPVKEIKWKDHFYILENDDRYVLWGLSQEFDEFYSWCSELENFTKSLRRDKKIKDILK